MLTQWDLHQTSNLQNIILYTKFAIFSHHYVIICYMSNRKLMRAPKWQALQVLVILPWKHSNWVMSCGQFSFIGDEIAVYQIPQPVCVDFIVVFVFYFSYFTMLYLTWYITFSMKWSKKLCVVIQIVHICSDSDAKNVHTAFECVRPLWNSGSASFHLSVILPLTQYLKLQFPHLKMRVIPAVAS